MVLQLFTAHSTDTSLVPWQQAVREALHPGQLPAYRAAHGPGKAPLAKGRGSQSCNSKGLATGMWSQSNQVGTTWDQGRGWELAVMQGLKQDERAQRTFMETPANSFVGLYEHL